MGVGYGSLASPHLAWPGLSHLVNPILCAPLKPLEMHKPGNEIVASTAYVRKQTVAEIARHHISANNEVEPNTRHNRDMASLSMPPYGFMLSCEFTRYPLQ